MYKSILFDKEAILAEKKGIDIACKSVTNTLGPRGRNVSYDKGYGGPETSNDGKDVLDQIQLKDPHAQMGVERVKGVASDTNGEGGDGTTTSATLYENFTTEGIRWWFKKGANVIALRDHINRYASIVAGHLDAMARPVTTLEELKAVTRISAESPEMGDIVAEIIHQIGPEGAVHVEESSSIGYQKEIVEGLELDKGYASYGMATDGDRMEAVYDKAAVLIVNKKITSHREIMGILGQLLSLGKKEVINLLVIAEDFSEEFVRFAVYNKERNAPFRILAVKSPGFGDRKKHYLEDIAIITGTKVVEGETGGDLVSVTINDLGRAEKVVSTEGRTKIIGGGGTKELINAHITRLKSQRDSTGSEYDKKKFEERIAKVSGGISILRIGAATESEMAYIKPKVEDAINSAKAAKEQGILPGGGVALLLSAGILRDLPAAIEYEDRAAREIVIRSIEAPFRQILLNAGFKTKKWWQFWKKVRSWENIDTVTDLIRNSIAGTENGPDILGVDVSTKELVHCFEKGITDPLKVTKAALKYASSGAASFLTIDRSIATIKEEQDHV